MSERVTIPSSTGELSGVLVAPAGDARVPAVVVIQEYWGINEQILAQAARWAEAGFLALVPDLFHGKVAKTAEEASALLGALDRARAVQEVGATIEMLRTHPRSTGKIAVNGFCMGGALAFAAAVHVRGLACVVPYYGIPGDLDWSQIDAPIQAHFARTDAWASVEAAEKIKAAVKVPMELFVYDAPHAFANERRPEVYNPEAAKLAWDRTLAFVRSHTR